MALCEALDVEAARRDYGVVIEKRSRRYELDVEATEQPRAHLQRGQGGA